MKIIKIIFFCILAIQYYLYIPLRVKKNFTRTYEVIGVADGSILS
jgi:hypothetical protein